MKVLLLSVTVHGALTLRSTRKNRNVVIATVFISQFSKISPKSERQGIMHCSILYGVLFVSNSIR